MKLQLLPSLTSLSLTDLTSSLPVNPKYTWDKLCDGPRDPLKLTTIAIHHDALAKEKYANVTDLQLASRIANGHIDSKANEKDGDAGFPYHIWIRNGKVYQCNDLLAFTYGVSSHNGYTIHVCVSGEYRFTDVISQEDYNMLATTIISLLKTEGLPNLKSIKGHRELDDTECPGIDMAKLRDDVAHLMYNMGYDKGEEDRFTRSYGIANYILYLYNMAVGKSAPDQPPVTPGARIWGRERLLTLESVVEELKKKP